MICNREHLQILRASSSLESQDQSTAERDESESKSETKTKPLHALKLSDFSLHPRGRTHRRS